RVILGVEWFATPYLTLLLEQGLASDRDQAASPLVDDALLWNTVSGPALTGPLLEGAAFGTAGEIQVVLLPLRRPTPVGRLVNVTWDGRRVPARESWETEAGYAVRFSRSFAAVDAAVWWMDAGDRRPWIGTAEDGAARPDHPRTRQAGYALEWVVGPTVLRSEGGLARRDRSWHSRVILGVEWFATPYLTLLLEQGLASDRDQAASPLVDDALLPGARRGDPVPGRPRGGPRLRHTSPLEHSPVDRGGSFRLGAGVGGGVGRRRQRVAGGPPSAPGPEDRRGVVLLRGPSTTARRRGGRGSTTPGPDAAHPAPCAGAPGAWTARLCVAKLMVTRPKCRKPERRRGRGA
ncbi:MAG: hypothetical protein P8188_12685, partial [Gemmatimonadota bacterium]